MITAELILNKLTIKLQSSLASLTQLQHFKQQLHFFQRKRCRLLRLFVASYTYGGRYGRSGFCCRLGPGQGCFGVQQVFQCAAKHIGNTQQQLQAHLHIIMLQIAHMGLADADTFGHCQLADLAGSAQQPDIGAGFDQAFFVIHNLPPHPTVLTAGSSFLFRFLKQNFVFI